MSIVKGYRIISPITLAIVSASGVKTEFATVAQAARVNEIPKKIGNAGLINVNGTDEAFTTTGGSGRGPTFKRYGYAKLDEITAFFYLTAEVLALLPGATITLAKVAPVITPVAAPEEVPAAPVAEVPAEPVAEAARAPRRERKTPVEA